MMGSSTMKVGASVVAVVAGLTLLRFKPWQRLESTANRPTLQVGYLPVT